MVSLGEIFAQNLRANRRRCGLTQAQLAEKVDVSTHHIGMLELRHNYPTFDLVERLAAALGIEKYELFVEPNAPHDELERLRHEIRGDMEQLLEKFLGKNPDDTCKDKQ
ncbi:MAG: helix-turn-helix domain-containing protein [Treponema sp.]|nr:helix-turn-helix domain-containing protein [Treponema sp.]